MEISFFCENRDYLRVKAGVPVRYRFLSETSGREGIGMEVHGETQDLSGGGILLHGTIPDEEWIPDLLMERITVGVSVFLPDSREPVKALARVAWLDADDDSGRSSSVPVTMGLKFVEITREAQDRMFQYILQDLLP